MIDNLDQLKEGLYAVKKRIYRVYKVEGEWRARGISKGWFVINEGCDFLESLKKFDYGEIEKYIFQSEPSEMQEDSNTALILEYLLERTAQLEGRVSELDSRTFGLRTAGGGG